MGKRKAPERQGIKPNTLPTFTQCSSRPPRRGGVGGTRKRQLRASPGTTPRTRRRKDNTHFSHDTGSGSLRASGRPPPPSHCSRPLHFAPLGSPPRCSRLRAPHPALPYSALPYPAPPGKRPRPLPPQRPRRGRRRPGGAVGRGRSVAQPTAGGRGRGVGGPGRRGPVPKGVGARP
ncbi:proline-rich protein HaeIII subfamily 1-like [Strigops habroptila]|uniref:proline-rich protein HaeIII subfamily 1-like n=1 Tax=Strigops habroptila TaxID=2489341 RepID=UPI0011CFE751|nr:proline-rich protein HaeIII subfamily 1-like [Strigops habroptila]